MEGMMQPPDAQKADFQVLPSPTHPNYRLWRNYADFARDRGALTTDIIAARDELEGLHVLDVGCGEGGTATVLAERGARVTAVDANPARVLKLHARVAHPHRLIVLRGDAQKLAFPAQTFDWVILQDVIEHLSKPRQALQSVARVLKPGGKLFLSTPNRWSPLNVLMDPHWNLPAIALLPRKAVIFCLANLLRRERRDREDFAALLSLRQLKHHLRHAGLQPEFVNTHVARALFQRPTAVVNSDLHLRIVQTLRRAHLDSVLRKLVNDRFGLFNYLFNPTWYLVAQKIT